MSFQNFTNEAEALALLATLSVEQLRAGRKRGLEQLTLIKALDAIDDAEMESYIGHPGQHPSKGYEAWVANDSIRRRQHLKCAIKDVEDELTRRGEPF